MGDSENTEIELLPQIDGDENGNGYQPRLAVDHDGKFNELYVIVGEETGGMIEGVSKEMYARLRERLKAAT